MSLLFVLFSFFFLNDPAPPEISPLSLHAALPICSRPLRSRGRARLRRPGSRAPVRRFPPWGAVRPERSRPGARPGRQARCAPAPTARAGGRSEEHTSELQSQSNIVCRLLLEQIIYLFFATTALKKDPGTRTPIISDSKTVKQLGILGARFM